MLGRRAHEVPPEEDLHRDSTSDALIEQPAMILQCELGADYDTVTMHFRLPHGDLEPVIARERRVHVHGITVVTCSVNPVCRR